jgi:hypothetical protein
MIIIYYLDLAVQNALAITPASWRETESSHISGPNCFGAASNEQILQKEKQTIIARKCRIAF